MLWQARVKLILKVYDFGICIGNALEESSEPLPFFNEHDCVENLQSFTDNKQNKDSMRDVLKIYTISAW